MYICSTCDMYIHTLGNVVHNDKDIEQKKITI